MPQAPGKKFAWHHDIHMPPSCHPCASPELLHIPEVGRRLDTRYTADKASSECGAVSMNFMSIFSIFEVQNEHTKFEHICPLLGRSYCHDLLFSFFCWITEVPYLYPLSGVYFSGRLLRHLMEWRCIHNPNDVRRSPYFFLVPDYQYARCQSPVLGRRDYPIRELFRSHGKFATMS